MTFYEDLKALINCHSLENNSDTPDHILADYMQSCLLAFEDGVKAREEWYGRRTIKPLSDAIDEARGGEAPTEPQKFA